MDAPVEGVPAGAPNVGHILVLPGPERSLGEVELRVADPVANLFLRKMKRGIAPLVFILWRIGLSCLSEEGAADGGRSRQSVGVRGSNRSQQIEMI